MDTAAIREALAAVYSSIYVPLIVKNPFLNNHTGSTLLIPQPRNKPAISPPEASPFLTNDAFHSAIQRYVTSLPGFN